MPHSPVHRLLEHHSFRRIVLTADGNQHLLFHDAEQFLQVCARGANLAEPVHLLTEVLSQEKRTRQFRSFKCFNALLASGTLGRKPSPDPQSQRLRTALRTLDGRLAGASYRDIAVALFGRDRVYDDWRASGDHLKNRIRRAAQLGISLMERRYRSLLK